MGWICVSSKQKQKPTPALEGTASEPWQQFLGVKISAPWNLRLNDIFQVSIHHNYTCALPAVHNTDLHNSHKCALFTIHRFFSCFLKLKHREAKLPGRKETHQFNAFGVLLAVRQSFFFFFNAKLNRNWMSDTKRLSSPKFWCWGKRTHWIYQKLHRNYIYTLYVFMNTCIYTGFFFCDITVLKIYILAHLWVSSGHWWLMEWD